MLIAALLPQVVYHQQTAALKDLQNLTIHSKKTQIHLIHHQLKVETIVNFQTVKIFTLAILIRILK